MPNFNARRGIIRPYKTPIVIESGGDFTEEGTICDGSSYLSVTGASWTDPDDLMVFVSFIPDNITATIQLMSGGAPARRLRMTDTGDLDTRWHDGAATTVALSMGYTSAINATGDRVNALIRFNASGADRGDFSLWDSNSGTWQNTGDGTLSGDGELDNDCDLQLLHSGGASIFDGTMYRFAMFEAAPDVSTATVRDNFWDDTLDTLVDPATSHTAYGTPIFDFYTTAAWNAGEPDAGSVTGWSKTGSFT